MSAVDPLSLVLGQISFAVSDLNKKELQDHSRGNT